MSSSFSLLSNLIFLGGGNTFVSYGTTMTLELGRVQVSLGIQNTSILYHFFVPSLGMCFLCFAKCAKWTKIELFFSRKIWMRLKRYVLSRVYIFNVLAKNKYHLHCITISLQALESMGISYDEKHDSVKKSVLRLRIHPKKGK